jgi:hypothetical protein
MTIWMTGGICGGNMGVEEHGHGGVSHRGGRPGRVEVGDQVEDKKMRWRGLDGREDTWRDKAWKTPSGRFLEGEAIAHVIE